MKKQKWIAILASTGVSCCLVAGLTACSGDKNKTNVVDDTVQYTYRNPDAVLPDYDTDVITVDGKLDETVYDSLRWWDAKYPEDDGVNVRATSYAGAKGIFFIFDVDDYAVNVNPLRVSWENSGITVYVAKSDARTLNDGVWEIELCPDNSINAKSYMGGYYYTTVQPDGFKNKPFARTVTKGGPVNTDECRGYVIESYFTYEYLFGSEDKPDGYKINYSLQRNSNLDKNHNRDTYYNFGQNMLGAYNWNVPSTWWSFNDNGVDSVIISTDVTGNGKIQFADKFISRYATTTANIIPDDGHRIKSVTFGEKDVTSQLKYVDGVNTLKLRNLAEDCSVSAEFEVIPDGQSALSGNVTFAGNALTAQQAQDLQVRVNLGGIVYTSDVDNGGDYTVNAVNGQGVIEVVSKRGYTVKRENIEVSGNAIKNIALTTDDYGNNRVITFDDEAVITSKVKLFDAADYSDTMNGTFTYAFNLKYNGKLLDGNGAAVDPTEGQYEHQYTSVNLYMTLKADNASENLHLQLLRWDSQWLLKTSIGAKNKASAVDNEFLRALGSEDGVNMLMVFGNEGVSFYRTDARGGVTQKILEIDLVNEFGMAAAERKVGSIDFYCENVVGHNIWAVENNTIALGKTINDYDVYEYYYQAKATLSENAKKLTTALGLEWDINHGAISGGLVDSFLIKASGVNAQGNVSKDEQIVLNMLGCDEWLNRLNATLHLKKDGGSYIGMNLGSVTDTYRRYVLSDAQMKALGGDGLNVYLVQSTDNSVYSLYVADGNNLVHVRDIESDGKGKAYGYELTYEGTNTVTCETSAFAGETTDKLLERINSYTDTEYSQITEGAITEIVELVNNTILSETYIKAHGGDDKGTVIATGKWDRGNSVWHYSAEVSNFFEDNAVSEDMTMKFNHFGTNEWGLNYWAYNVYFKLDSANNTAIIEFQEGTGWTKSTYELTADELSALAASGRLDFYAIRNSENKLTLCIGNADETVKVTALVMDTASNFGVATLKVETLTYGAAVAVNCHNYYVDYNLDVGKTAQELINATCSDDVAPDKVRYITHVAEVEPGHATEGNIEYWMCDGRYYSDAEATVEISQADTVIGPVGHNYDTNDYKYDLTHHWTVCPDDGAQSEHASHISDGNGNCTVCGARPLGTLKRVPAKESSCTEKGNKEYWTDGYYYFEDENHTVATTLEEVTLKELPHTLGELIPDGDRHYEQCSVCKEKFYSDHEYTDGQCGCGAYEALTYKLLQTKSYTATGNSGSWMADWDNGNSIWHFGIGLSHFIDGDGKVVKDAEIKVAMRSEASDWSEEDQNNVIVKLSAANDAVTVTFQTFITNWSTLTPYTLSAQQRAQIGADRVLHVYVLHTKFGSEHKDILCVRDKDGVVATEIETGTRSKTSYQRHIVETLTENVSLAVDIVNFGKEGKTYKQPVSMLIGGAEDKFNTPERVLKFVQGTAATCTENGVYDYYTDGIKNYADAEGSEELQTIVITAPGHDFDTTQYKTNPQYHWYECKRCGAKQNEEEHSWSNGECVVCHTEQKVPDNLTDLPANEATCTTRGNIACKTDGTYYWTADGKWLSEEEVFTTPALGHDYAYVTTDATEHYKKCSRCGEVEAGTRGNHDWTNGNCVCGKAEPDRVVLSVSKEFTGEADDQIRGGDWSVNLSKSLTQFTVKAPDAFNGEAVKGNATITMQLHCANGYYNWFETNLCLSPDSCYINVTSNSDVKISNYTLSEYQLGKIKTDGLEIYVTTDGKIRTFYVETAQGRLLNLGSFTAPSNDNVLYDYRVTYAAADYGAEVSCKIVKQLSQSVAHAIKESLGVDYTFELKCVGEWNGTGSVASTDVGAKSGNYFIRYNVKLPNQKQLTAGEKIQLNYDCWNYDMSCGVSIRLQCNADGTYALASSGAWYGGTKNIWANIDDGVVLTKAQADKLTTTGLDFFLVHTGNDIFLSLYVYDGTEVTKVADLKALNRNNNNELMQTHNAFKASAKFTKSDDSGYSESDEYAGKTAQLALGWYLFESEVTAEDAIKTYLKTV